MRFLLVALLLAGCAAAPVKDSDPISIPELTFPNYHELVRNRVASEITNPKIPSAVASNYAQCWADATVGRLTPDEVGQMDRFAQGRVTMTAGEVRASDEAVYHRAGAHDRWEFLAPYCPGLIAQFKSYP